MDQPIHLKDSIWALCGDGVGADHFIYAAEMAGALKAGLPLCEACVTARLSILKKYIEGTDTFVVYQNGIGTLYEAYATPKKS